MRLDIVGDSIVEKLGLFSGMVPTPLIYATFGVGYARSLVAATRLGVFEAIGEGGATLDQICERTGCHPEGIRALCAALTGFHFVTRYQGHYQNSKAVKRWVLRGSKESLTEAVLFMGWCHDRVLTLEDDVRTGEVVRVHDEEHDESFWSSYMGALAAFARIASKEVVKRVKLQAPKKLLDIGGGHGIYSAAFCQKFPSLQAEVLDLPGACEQGRKIIEAEGLSERVSFREGDARTDEWGEGYDTILIFNILHNATAEESQVMLKRAYDALAPGGRLVVCDAKHLGQDAKLDASAGWNELFFYLISGAQAWPEAKIKGWMEEASFTNIQRIELWFVPQVILQGTKP